MNDIDYLPRIRELLAKEHELVKEMGTNPFYNNKWRVLSQKEELCSLLGLSPELVQVEASATKNFNKTRKTYDIICSDEKLIINKGESKGEWHDASTINSKNLGNMCFDKQNDAVRRQETMEYDFLGYSAFSRNGDILYSIYFLSCAMPKVLPIIKKYQDEKVMSINEAELNNTRITRDDIKVPVYELLNAVEDNDVIVVMSGCQINRSKFLKEINDHNLRWYVKPLPFFPDKADLSQG